MGYDADLVLVDLETTQLVRRETLETKCGWSPFEGWELTGWPTTTIVGGNIAMRDGIVDDNVRGKALEFAPYPDPPALQAAVGSA